MKLIYPIHNDKEPVLPHQKYQLVPLAKNEHKSFNAFLAAIALKKAKVVQFALNNMEVAVRYYGKQPLELVHLKAPPEDHFFCLRLVVATQDTSCLEHLWSANFTGLWTLAHLAKFAELALLADWVEGLKLVYESFTTEAMLQTLPMT